MQYNVKAARQFFSLIGNSLVIPNNNQWSNWVNSKVQSFTGGNPSQNDLKQLAALVASSNLQDYEGKLAYQLYLAFINALHAQSVSQDQITGLEGAIANAALTVFRAPSPMQMAARQQHSQTAVVRPRPFVPPPTPMVQQVQQVYRPAPVPQGLPPQAYYQPPPPPPPSPYAVAPQPAPPAPPPYTPAVVVQAGTADLQRKAWNVVQKINGGDVGAINYLANQQAAAQQGDWMARQFLTFAQSAFQQTGQDPTPARWAGEVSESVGYGCNTQDYLDAIGLINRARSYDQNAIATLRSLHSGGPRAKRILRCVQEYHGGAVPSFGAQKRAATHRASKPTSSPSRHPAITALRSSPSSSLSRPIANVQLRGMAGSSFNAATPPTGSAASPAAVQTAAKHRQRQQQQSQQGDGSGSGSGDGGGQGDGSQPDDGGGLGDTNLSPTTGQQSNPEAADLVNRSRAGDKSATQTIQETMRADRAGDPRARVLAQGILEYTKGHAEFAGEMLTGHAANLSHSHPLTQRRVKRIGDDLAATFGAEGHRVYLAHVASPFGPPSGYKPAFMGQVVGRAQAMQAARFPMGGVRFLSPKAARELGE